jgi:hypothetical protein
MNRYLSTRKIVYLTPLVLLLFLYVGDLLWFSLRSWLPSLGATTSSVHRIRLLAIPDKGNRVEFQIDVQQPEEDVPCSRSIFPQGKNRPCWYVSRHAKDPIPM